MSNKNVLPKWFWWVIGGLITLIILAVVIIIILLVSPSRRSFAILDWEAPERVVCTDLYDEEDYGDGDYTGDCSFPGRYPDASMRLLTESDLYGLSKWELKIMRNEILARYGYIFKTEAMQDYFSQQSWYEGRYSEVNEMLTDLEWENIKLIKRFENR